MPVKICLVARNGLTLRIGSGLSAWACRGLDILISGALCLFLQIENLRNFQTNARDGTAASTLQAWTALIIPFCVQGFLRTVNLRSVA